MNFVFFVANSYVLFYPHQMRKNRFYLICHFAFLSLIFNLLELLNFFTNEPNKRAVPWGISESGYNAIDISLSYQYQAFGVPAWDSNAGSPGIW